MTRSVRYQPILHTLYYTLHTEHAYCLSYCFLNNEVTTTVIEMVEMVEILDGRLGKRSVERVRYVINNLLHLVIVKYGVISLVKFHSFYCVCMRSFEHFCCRRKIVLLHGESVRSFPKDSIFACIMSGGQEQEQVFVAMKFTVQVSTFLLNRSCYGISR